MTYTEFNYENVVIEVFRDTHGYILLSKLTSEEIKQSKGI
jgi:hypothetical protein